MRSLFSKYLIFAAAALIGIAGAPAPASAGVFNVKPIKVFLNKDSGSTVLTIENQASAPLRLQIRAFAWTNDRHGQPVLAPSDDVIIFPTLVNIMPMERRSIRVGFTGKPAAKEQTYRIALDEMPSLESQLSRAKQPGLEVRTRITVPVFFSPTATSAKAEIDGVTVRRGTAQATFTNEGNIHATVSSAEIVGRDSSGAKVFDKKVNGWYVLAGDDWQFQANLGTACNKIKTIVVTVESDFGHFSRSADASAGDCK
jgi:fimbrial chaperone protein